MLFEGGEIDEDREDSSKYRRYQVQLCCSQEPSNSEHQEFQAEIGRLEHQEWVSRVFTDSPSFLGKTNEHKYIKAI